MSDQHRNARRRGKDKERAVAKALGGTRRTNYKGLACSDLDGVPWSVEVTCSKNEHEFAIRKKWGQAVRNAKLEGLEPVLVFSSPRKPLKDALVVCRFELFAALAADKTGPVEGGIGRRCGDRRAAESAPPPRVDGASETSQEVE